MAYQVLYVDEQVESRGNFDELSDDNIRINSIHPFASEEEMLNYISNEKYDAVVFDYGLKTNDPNIQYNGGDIINRINELREDYPAFILTQDIEQDGGVDENVLSTKVLQKRELADTPEVIKRKIISSIKMFQKQNENISKEITALVEKRKKQEGFLDDNDIERLNFLDSKMERRIQGERQFPDIIKESESIHRLNNILKEAEDFISKNLKKH